MPDYELIKEMVDAIDDRGRGLTTWEEQFIASCKGHFKMKGYLSPKQIEHIEKIYRERTPDGKREPLSFNTVHGLTPAQKMTDRFRNEGRDDFGSPGISRDRRIAREKGYDE